ncbi:MAG: aminodeoxychorismate synthase [Lachnospiraceae bacterium]|nr:aminodeoxychorismate synthase [Lachnospiraceae bacterium]
MRTLIIDNYDSFTFNIYQYVAEITGNKPIVIRNNQSYKELVYDNIIISPGPGSSDKHEDFGVNLEILQNEDVPILGICLGHQGICVAYSGEVILAREPYHGRIDKIIHNGAPLFNGIPETFNVVRYHSMIMKTPIPDCLEIIGVNDEGIVMAVNHKEKPIWGVQFHPESICTEYGKQLLKNFYKLTADYNSNKSLIRQSNNLINKQVTVVPQCKNERVANNKYKVEIREVGDGADTEKIFEELYANDEDAVWLDSSKIMNGFSRFSYLIGKGGKLFEKLTYQCNALSLIVEKYGKKEKLQISIFDYMEKKLEALYIETPDISFDFNCGYVGYFGYEMKMECGHSRKNESELPDAIFLFADRVIVMDHLENKVYLMAITEKNDADTINWLDQTEKTVRKIGLEVNDYTLPVKKESGHNYVLSRGYEQYMNDINVCLQKIKEGESYEICLTNKMIVNQKINAWEYYRVLRRINGAPYGGFLRFGSLHIASSSPERYISINKERIVEAKPMKGTIKRSENHEEDLRLYEFLQSDEKTISENLMICDLLRNDLGIVCEIGSVNVPQLMKVESFASVHQMISLIKGKLRKGISAVECLKQSFPGGSMTGAPKKRTIEIIEELEKEPRGIYSGCIGYIGLNGTADFNIVIRTAVITPDKLKVGVGGAIIAMSDPQEEFDEILLKGSAMMEALKYLN